MSKAAQHAEPPVVFQNKSDYTLGVCASVCLSDCLCLFVFVDCVMARKEI